MDDIRAFEIGECLEQVYELNARCFRALRDLERDEALGFLLWKYGDSPFGRPSGLPRCWGIFSGKKLVAFIGRIPVGVKASGRIYRACWESDIMVDPECRGRGLAKALANSWEPYFDVSLILNLNEKSYSLRQKEGWKDLYEDERRISLLNPMRSAWNLAFRKMPDGKGVAAPGIEEVSDGDDGFIRFLDSWNRSGEYGIQKDPGYLAWRFGYCASYKKFVHRQGRDVTGFLVLCVTQERGWRQGAVLDLLANDPHTERKLMAFAKSHFASQMAHYAVMLSCSRKQKRFASGAGYRGRLKRYRFMVKTNHESCRGLLDPENWCLNLSDGDVMYLRR